MVTNTLYAARGSVDLDRSVDYLGRQSLQLRQRQLTYWPRISLCLLVLGGIVYVQVKTSRHRKKENQV